VEVRLAAVDLGGTVVIVCCPRATNGAVNGTGGAARPRGVCESECIA
jgi:hypothetical protein